MKMHEDQVDVEVASVRAVVADQLPRWRDREVTPLHSTGTVNALFRLGGDVVLRFPLQPSVEEQQRAGLVHEQEIARRVAGISRVEVPEPLTLGEPGEHYAGWWTAYRWIPGEPAEPDGIGDPVVFARDLADFVTALQGLDTHGLRWDGRSRGGPLAVQDAGVRDALARSAELVDVPALKEVWERSLAAEPSTTDVWIHADLMPGNLLVRDGRLAAVIDLGATCVGDPAVDLMPAWNLFSAPARTAYREALQVDDATWERGRGWALVQAIVALPYYVDTNRHMAQTARRTLDALLEEARRATLS